jgi:hypothetical protein
MGIDPKSFGIGSDRVDRSFQTDARAEPARPESGTASGAAGATVLVDAENVRRSRWPNLSKGELVDTVRAWGTETGHPVLIVFDGPAPEEAPDLVGARGSADDWLAANAAEHVPYWLVTSDRELRERAGGEAEQIVGGGAFLRELGY